MTAHKPEGRRWVTKEQYIRYFILCYKMLNPDSGMSERAQRKCLQQEWENDARGLPALTFMAFFKAVFEMLGMCSHCGITGMAERKQCGLTIVCVVLLACIRPMVRFRGR